MLRVAQIGFAIGMLVVTTGACGPSVPGGYTLVATSERTATIQVGVPDAVAEPQALELTVRPTKLVRGAAFLVRVFAGPADLSPEAVLADGQFLGNFSLFSAREGAVGTFVVDPPDPALSDANNQITLAIQIVPAHPDADLGETALEVLGVQVIR